MYMLKEKLTIYDAPDMRVYPLHLQNDMMKIVVLSAGRGGNGQAGGLGSLVYYDDPDDEV